MQFVCVYVCHTLALSLSLSLHLSLYVCECLPTRPTLQQSLNHHLASIRQSVILRLSACASVSFSLSLFHLVAFTVSIVIGISFISFSFYLAHWAVDCWPDWLPTWLILVVMAGHNDECILASVIFIDCESLRIKRTFDISEIAVQPLNATIVFVSTVQPGRIMRT